MAVKKYSFVKVLAEYNKKYNTIYKLKSSINKATIVHRTDNSFYVAFIDYLLVPRQELLSDFIFYKVSTDSTITKNITAIIMLEETKKLKIKIEIWPSNKIKYAYLYTNYLAKTGQLGNSCMRQKEMQKSLNFYVRNNAKIVVVIDSNNKIHARALLWENVKSTDRKSSFTYMDRVYSSSDSLLLLFYDLAKENKWKHYDSTSAGKGKGTYYIDNLDIKNICHLPYTDTFRYLFYKDNLIAGSTDTNIKQLVKHPSDCVSLTHTGEGGYQPVLDKNRVREACTNNFISKKDGVFVKRYDGFVAKKNIANINGDYYSRHDKEIAESKLDKFILVKNSVNEVFTNEVIDKTKATHSEKHKGYIHKSNIVKIRGELYHKQDTDITSFCDKWYHISECFINYDREKRNKALAKQKFHFWIDNEVFIPHPDNFVTRKEGLIPKECAIVAYNLVYNPVIGYIEYQEVYHITKSGLIQLTTGEYIVDSSANRGFLKKFNNKWYIKQTAYDVRVDKITGKLKEVEYTVIPKLPDKNQLTFAFIGRK